MSQAHNETELLLHADQFVPYILPDSIQINECYEVKIENIYDPSKFWLIIKVQELKLFMRYLKHFYDKAENRNSICKNKIEKELVCIVFRNDRYYRSIVQPLLLPDLNKIRVFMIDYGLIVNVCIDEVFYIFKKHCEVPRFAIRACLADISPYDSSNTWSHIELKSFCALIKGRSLQAKVCDVDSKRCILFVDIRAQCGTMCKSVNVSMITMKLAKYWDLDDHTQTEKFTKYRSKVKYLYLCPTFEALENGIVPCSLWEHDLLKNAVPLDVLYKNYYKYEEFSGEVNFDYNN